METVKLCHISALKMKLFILASFLKFIGKALKLCGRLGNLSIFIWEQTATISVKTTVQELSVCDCGRASSNLDKWSLFKYQDRQTGDKLCSNYYGNEMWWFLSRRVQANLFYRWAFGLCKSEPIIQLSFCKWSSWPQTSVFSEQRHLVVLGFVPLW